MKHLKSLKSILLAGILFASLTPQNVRADVDVNATNFPDPVFRALITTYASVNGNSSVLSDTEIRLITELVYEHVNYSSSNDNIKNLKGIEYLTNLRELRCMNNDISSVDLSKNTQLLFLDLSGNKLTNIDLSKNTKLTGICLSDNQLTSLDLTKNTYLETAYMDVNQLRAVRFSTAASNLYSVSCIHNQLNYAAMQRMIFSLPVDLNGSKTRSLYTHSWIDDTGEEGNCSIDCDYAKALGWSMWCYLPNGNKHPYMYPYSKDPSPVAFNSTNFPDANFRTYISSLGCVENGKISALAAAQVTTMNCSGKGIKSLKGIEFFTGLEELNCSNNDITELDVSKNVFLNGLSVSQNSIYGAEMGKLINSLPKILRRACYDTELPGSGYGSLTCYYAFTTPNTTYLEGNTLSLAQAQTCYNKIWTPTIFIDGQMYNYWDMYAGYTMLREAPLNINPKTFPDANFRSALRSNSYGADGQFYASEIENMTSLSVTNANITDFTGLHYFTALKNLSLRGQTNLTSVDVSKNVNLEKLECCYNKLASLSLTNNTKLKELYVNDTQLSSLDLYPVRNTLETLVCGSSKLTSLNLTSLSKLTGLNCQNNGMTTLNVTQNTALKTLYCGSNKLESLNLANNTQLTGLYCYSNKLTSLNLSKNTALTVLYCNSNQLETLDLTYNQNLMNLNCEYNKLTSLTLPPMCNSLKYVHIHNNMLGEAAMTAIINSLYSNTSGHSIANPTREFYPYSLRESASSGKSENNFFSIDQFESIPTMEWIRGYVNQNGSNTTYDVDNHIYCKDLNGMGGNMVSLPIYLDINSSQVSGFSFDIVLPKEVSLATVTKQTTRLNSHTVDFYSSGFDQSTNSYVYHVTVTPSSSTSYIQGYSGKVLDALLMLTNNSVNGVARIHNTIMMVGPTVTMKNQGPFTSKIIVTKKGDVNYDNNITPADAIMILYHYFGVRQLNFNIDAADMNNDGSITPADAIETLYKYFGANGARPTLPASLATEAGEPE